MSEIVGFWGVARAGKDTAAAALTAVGWGRAGLADALKRDLAPLVEAMGFRPDADPADKEAVRELWVAYGRVGRKRDPDHLIDRIELPAGPCAVTDVRYLSEVRWVQRRGGLVILVNRPGHHPVNQEEWQSFGEIGRAIERRELQPIPVVQNDGTVEQLHHRVRQIVTQHFAPVAA